MRILKLALFGTILLGVSWATSFAVMTLLFSPDASAQTEPFAGGERAYWNVSSVEEAKQIAGFDIAAPTYLPDGFVPGPKILVNEAPHDKQKRIVERGWKSSEHPGVSIYLLQRPDPFSIGGGQPATINGIPGQRKLLPAHPPFRPYPVLSFSWREGEFTYLLSGSMGGSLTEEAIQQVAASISQS